MTAEQIKESREKAVKRTKQLVYYFADFMLEEEAKAAKNRAEFEKAQAEGKTVIMVSCAENNIRCMHNCMKAADDVVKFLRNKDNEVEEWQLAAINAMYDTCNTMEEGQVTIPFDLPYAIKGLLLQWEDSDDGAGIMLEAIKE